MNSMNEFMQNLRGVIRGELNTIHTALHGKILAHDPGSNRASVQPLGKFKVEDGRALDYPVIANVPVCFPCSMGGGAGITFPLQEGDGCLLVFHETQMDDYLSGGDSEDPRKYSLNDAICIPGLYPNVIAPSNQHPNDVCISCCGNFLKVGAEGLSGQMNGTGFSFTGGKFTFDGDVVINGISFLGHVHGGVQPGGGSTSTPK